MAPVELHTSYRVILKDGKLKLWHLFNGEISLKSVWYDEFLSAQWYARNIEFSRNDSGTITGLKVSQYRAKNKIN